MKLRKIFVWDLKFQAKYGFYLLYGLLTALYLVILLSLPSDMRQTAASIFIFSDPAAMGLFFMGAIILLEKSQKVTSYFAISPLKASEYIASKIISLNVIALVVAAVLGIIAEHKNLPMMLIGTVISSIFFTLLGIIITTKISSLNQFLLATLPVEILAFVPAILHLFRVTPSALAVYPVNTFIDLIAGNSFSVIGLVLGIILNVLLFFITKKCVMKMWISMGGVKL